MSYQNLPVFQVREILERLIDIHERLGAPYPERCNVWMELLEKYDERGLEEWAMEGNNATWIINEVLFIAAKANNVPLSTSDEILLKG